jgi:hypothetical protein
MLTLLGVLPSLFKTSVELRLENLALRHQIGVLRRSAPKRLQLMPADRILWGLVTQFLGGLEIRPADREARDGHRWHRKGFVSIGLGKFGAGSPCGPPCRRRFVI